MKPLNDAVVLLPLRGRHAEGKYAVVDANLPHLPAILQCRWYLTDRVYVRTFDWEDENRVAVKLHRVVLDPPPGVGVDHINRDPLDNRRENLRVAQASHNAMNRRRSPGRVPYRGVSARGAKFHAKLRWRNESLHLGDFDTARDAARVYDIFALLLAGEFAVPNFEKTRYRTLLLQLRQLLALE